MYSFTKTPYILPVCIVNKQIEFNENGKWYSK